MTGEEIIDLFIRAAETDRLLPNTARPARLKSLPLPVTHSFSDMNGWGSERLEEERQAFWDERARRPKASDVTAWERCNALITLIDDESQRRCLWHWSTAKAGGRPFATWCRHEEHIHVETGSRRKNRAVAKIVRALAVGEADVFEAVAEVVEAIEAEVPVSQHSWMADGAFNPVFTLGAQRFDWAEKRNRARRERERRRRER